MRVCAIVGILLSLIFVASNESVRASDANEIQKMMANALRQQATVLASQGLLEQAETFLRAAKQIEMNLEGRGLVGGHLSLAGVTDEPQIIRARMNARSFRRATPSQPAFLRCSIPCGESAFDLVAYPKATEWQSCHRSLCVRQNTLA